MAWVGRLWRSRVWMGTIVTLVIVIYFILFYGDSNGDKILLADPEQCYDQFGATRDEDIKKIQSYNFPDAEPYLEELFSTNENIQNINQSKPVLPVIATAASSNHFTEIVKLVENINSVVRPVYKDIKLYLFDLGLSISQTKKLLPWCNCEIIQFPFDKYPNHVRLLKGYAWKPIAIQLSLLYHPFVLWMDASIRFTTNDLNFLWEDAKKFGALTAIGFGNIAGRTSEKTFQYLHEEPCLYRDVPEMEATFIAVYEDTFIRDNFMKPWVSCALQEGCMVIDNDPGRYLNCLADSDLYYFQCHRFDQSVMSILLTRLFHGDIEQHKMNHTFYEICKGGDGYVFLPSFMNDIIFTSGNSCF